MLVRKLTVRGVRQPKAPVAQVSMIVGPSLESAPMYRTVPITLGLTLLGGHERERAVEKNMAIPRAPNPFLLPTPSQNLASSTLTQRYCAKFSIFVSICILLLCFNLGGLVGMLEDIMNSETPPSREIDLVSPSP